MNCPPQVVGKLKAVDGVSDCKVDYASKTAQVTVKKGTDTTALIKALEGTQFDAKVTK